jgi:hypothetical protein
VPERPTSWQTFLHAHWVAIAGADFFTTEVLTWRGLVKFYTVSVSNSLSGRHWKLDQVPAVGNPTHIVQLGADNRVSAGEIQRRVASNDAWLRAAL